MEKSKKALFTTFSLTVLLFSFIIAMLYIIYCYAYYDGYQEQVFIDNVNDNKYSFIYKKLVGKGSLTYEEFNSSIDLLTNKDRLSTIYDSYFKDSVAYPKEIFLNTYYFDEIKVDKDSILFGSNGNTNLFNRKALFYDEITVSNGSISTVIGVLNKVSFKIEDTAILRVDNKQLDCAGSVCVVDKIYGGLHELSYVSNGYEYYALVNIYKDKQVINVSNSESLVKVEDHRVDLKYGKYVINKCNIENIDECPSMSKSYLILNEDNTFVAYTYFTTGRTSIITEGTFNYNNGVLNLSSRKYGKETYSLKGIYLIGNNTKYNYVYVG